VGEEYPSVNNFQERYFLFATVFIMLLVASLYLYNLDGWLVADDEGTDLYEVWRISEGDVPGVDLITEQLPVFLLGGVGLGRLSGFDINVLRGTSAVLVWGSSWLVFLLGRETWNARVGFFGVILYLLNHLTYRQARLFRPDPWMLAFSVLGLYLFVLAHTRNSKWCLLLAGSAYGVATLCKLFGVLPLGGCLLFGAHQFLISRISIFRFLRRMALLLVPFVLISVGGVLVFYPPGSAYYGIVLGQHWRLGAQQGLFYRPVKGLVGIAVFLAHNLVFLFTIPLIYQFVASRRIGESVLAWQMPSGLAYLVLSRPIYERYWLYLIPVFSLMLGHLVDRLLKWIKPHGGDRRCLPIVLAGVLLVGLGVIQSVPTILQHAKRHEEDTRALASYIAAHTAPDELVLSDYAGLNFYARRPSVPQASIIAGGRIKGGFVTGAGLIEEIETRNVAMVVLHVSGGNPGPHHLVNLKDFDEFHTYLNDHFYLAENFNRAGQMMKIYQTCSERNG
jgi:hypothetical protein